MVRLDRIRQIEFTLDRNKISFCDDFRPHEYLYNNFQNSFNSKCDNKNWEKFKLIKLTLITENSLIQFLNKKLNILF